MGSRRWKIPAGAITTILMSSGPHLHLKGCPEFLFCARTRLGDQRIKLWTCMDYWCSHFLFSVLLKERNLIDCAVRSCSFRIGIRACSGLSSIMLFKNIPGLVMWCGAKNTNHVHIDRMHRGTAVWHQHSGTKSTEGKMEQTILHISDCSVFAGLHLNPEYPFV